MYDSNKFFNATEAIYKTGRFRGHPLLNRTDLYKILAEELEKRGMKKYNSETIKKWRGNATIPKMPVVIALEEMLGVSLRSDETQNQSNEKEDKNDMNKVNIKTNYNELTKWSLFNVNGILKRYLNNGDIETEDCYCSMLFEVELERPAIPDPLYTEIKNFIKTNIEPYIYGAENEHVENEEGYQTDEAVKQLLANYFKAIMDIEAKWDAYASEKLYPIIRA